MDDHGKSLFDAIRFGPAGPVETPRTDAYDTPAVPTARRALGLPFVLPETKKIDPAKIGELFSFKLLLVSEQATNFQPVFRRYIKPRNSEPDAGNFDPVAKMTLELLGNVPRD